MIGTIGWMLCRFQFYDLLGDLITKRHICLSRISLSKGWSKVKYLGYVKYVYTKAIGTSHESMFIHRLFALVPQVTAPSRSSLSVLWCSSLLSGTMEWFSYAIQWICLNKSFRVGNIKFQIIMQFYIFYIKMIIQLKRHMHWIPTLHTLQWNMLGIVMPAQGRGSYLWKFYNYWIKINLECLIHLLNLSAITQ